MCQTGGRPAQLIDVGGQPQGSAHDEQDWLEVRATYARVLAHDIRAPMSSMQFALEDLRAKAVGTPMAEQVYDLLECAREWRTMTEGLVAVCLASSEDTSSEEAALGEILQSVRALSARRCSSKGIRLRLARTRLLIRTNRWVLGAIITNLVTNAIKHSHCTDIFVGAHKRGDQVQIWVGDNGIGLSPEVAQRLFARPQVHGRLDDLRSESHGFGLYAVGVLAARIGGTVRYVRGRPTGSWFCVELRCEPRYVAAEAVQPLPDWFGADARPLEGKVVVVLDDDVDIARATGATFARLGAHVHVYQRVEPMLDALKGAAAGADLVVLDFFLDVDRTTAAQIWPQIKQVLGRAPAAVLLSGERWHPLMKGLADEMVKLTKPLDAESLSALVHAFLVAPDSLVQAFGKARMRATVAAANRHNQKRRS